MHLAMAFVRRHRSGSRLVSPFVLPSFLLAATPWLWTSSVALIVAATAHVVWFVVCELLAPRAVPSAGRPTAVEPPRRSAPVTSGFVSTSVLAVLEEASDIKTFRLVRPDTFSFTAGQFVAVRVSIDGKPHVRCYSISSSPEAR